MDADALAMIPQIPHISIVDDVNRIVALVTSLSIIGLIVLSVAIAAGLFFIGPLSTAKALIASIFAVIGLIFFGIVLFSRSILAELITLEELGYLVQEETIVGARDARRMLSNVRSKLDMGLHPDPADLPDLIRHVGPLVGLLMRKEKSVMSWAMFGFKFAKNAFDIYRQRNK